MLLPPSPRDYALPSTHLEIDTRETPADDEEFCALAIFASLLAGPVASTSAIEVNLFFLEEDDPSPLPNGFGGLAGRPPSGANQLFGGGTLEAIMQAAVDDWVTRIEGDRTVDVYVAWSPRGPNAVGSTLTSDGGFGSGPSVAYLRVASDRSWFMDPTPHDDEEFTDYYEDVVDLGGGPVVAGRGYTGATGEAAGRLDLYTVALAQWASLSASSGTKPSRIRWSSSRPSRQPAPWWRWRTAGSLSPRHRPS